MYLIEDRKEWTQAIEQCSHADFYHTYDYAWISKNCDEKPVLLKYTEGKALILLPLLIREIKGTNLKDATSVYGYVGPLSKNIDEGFNNENFRKRLNVFLTENKIISVFSRLHPYIENQNQILNGIGEVVCHGKVVDVDLTKTPEEQLKQYNRRLKTYINKESKEYEVINGSCEEYLDTFIATYCASMKRVNAKPSYFFGKTYFYNFMASNEIKAELLIAKHKETGRFAGGAIFTKKGKTIQYHLSGVNPDYYELNPTKILIDHIRNIGTQQGFTHFNLGGGLGGHDKDSLFYFKSGFSKKFRDFCTWQYIVDKTKYNLLIKQKGNLDDLTHKNSCFFPLYRQNMTTEDVNISEINCLADDR
ncbi:GNAT family N-acetyltransferase [Flagellimonas zhangzhouensis]|uniref:Acetyltransferase (GNAT) domain-containing protein n=1 Tax=Flagellimonas zhangzhouensis TaxID=1073328 RepID=A0A1H2RPP7_9FLAO|nr:GNAT family N-acetyltransferase [Allomuricauda zhangzhouensis]SDQ66126.1 Acetyltransferase (GNAT) domain-containing protein [Allomuricauda zhangzhouensis]SDW21130.1 Acetyltransferase (GNAT) domain-containing protein [Allomuricauda zhangzhouensis]